jgi:hypothetical protein
VGGLANARIGFSFDGENGCAQQKVMLAGK